MTSATTDERDTALAMVELDTALGERSGQIREWRPLVERAAREIVERRVVKRYVRDLAFRRGATMPVA